MSAKRTADALLTFGVGAILVTMMLFLLVPVVITLLMAFDARETLGRFPPPGYSLRWFTALWHHDYLWTAFYNSIILAVASTIIATIVGALAALAISRMVPSVRDAFTTLFLSPLVLPGVIIGFALLMSFSILGQIPTFARLLAGHLIIVLPYTVRMTLIGLAGISASLREAALGLGATERETFFTVTLPLAKNGIAAGSIFAFAFSMDDVAISMFLSDFNTFTLPVALISLMKAQFDLTLAACAVGLMALTIILLFVLERVLGVERAMGQGIYRT